MKKTALLLVVLTLAIQGCAHHQRESKEEKTETINDNRPCAANFTSDGSFWGGRSFRTYMDSKMSKNNAFSSLAASFASHGYAITASDRESGLISGNSAVMFGNGKVVPMNATVKSIPSGGSHAELTFQLSGGLSASLDAIKKEFCGILDPLDQK